MPRTTEGNPIALTQLLEGNPVATFVIDAEHRVTHWNRACEVLTGVSAVEMIGRNEQWRAFYAEPRPVLADLIVDQAVEVAVATFYDSKFKRSELIDGGWEAEDFFPAFGENGRWLFFTAAAIRNDENEIVGAIETLQDVTARKQAEAALHDSTAFLSQIIDGSSVATLVINAEHRVTHWNHACEVLTGMSASNVIGTENHWKAFYAGRRSIMADLVLDGAGDVEVGRLYHGRYRQSALVQGGYEAEDFFPHFGDGGRWLFFTAAPLRNAAGDIVGAIETLQDVTERRRAEEALRESEERYRTLSLTDSLTGLFNSRHLHDCLIAEAQRTLRYGRPLSLLVLDCDNFKRVNDSFGHLEGDRVLQMLAEVIRHCMRRSDSGFRYGGEEFVILMPETALSSAQSLAERLRSAFSAQVLHSAIGEEIRCTVSIGVAEWMPGDSQKSIIQRADAACYRAKERGKNCVIVASASE